MGGAVEMCSGLGACRKKLEGTMCPSYMATQEEADSTRGRANVLRLAMAGRLGEAGLGDEGVYQVLDLCLECRACKAECPVGVDVARFKSEFLADYWSRHGMSRHARILGNARTLGDVGQPFAPVSNWVMNAAFRKYVAQTMARHRPAPALPTFASRTLAAQAPRADERSDAILVQRYVHELLRPGNRPGRARRAAGGRHSSGGRRRTIAAAGRRSRRVCSEKRVRWPREIPTRCIRTRPRDAGSSSASRAASRPCARTRRRCFAGDARDKARSRGLRVCAVRGVCRARRQECPAEGRAPPRFCFTAIATRNRWACSRRRRRFWRVCPARP